MPRKKVLVPTDCRPADCCPACGSKDIGWCELYGGWWCACGRNAQLQPAQPEADGRAGELVTR
jgi:hypothetical protein